MTEQELIIQGNQASALMPELKRYIDEQIIALAEKDKNTLFVNFSAISIYDKLPLLYFGGTFPYCFRVYPDAYFPWQGGAPEGEEGTIQDYILNKYSENYPWLDKSGGLISNKLVAGYISFSPRSLPAYDDAEADAPWLRLGYNAALPGNGIVEQHFRGLKKILGMGADTSEKLFITRNFLNENPLWFALTPEEEEDFTPALTDITFFLKGWMLFKNS